MMWIMTYAKQVSFWKNKKVTNKVLGGRWNFFMQNHFPNLVDKNLEF